MRSAEASPSVPGLGQVADGVQDHQPRMERCHLPVHEREMRLEAGRRGPRGHEPQQSLFQRGTQIDADGPHVADDLARRFFEREVEAALAPTAALGGEVGGQAALARARRAAHEHAAPSVDARAAQHDVEAGNAGRDLLVAGGVIEPDGGDRQDREPVLIDQERVLVRPVRGAAILHHPQASRGNLVGDPVVEEDHAVRNVLLEALPGERAVAPLGGDDGGHPLVLQPAEQAHQLGPKNRLVGEPAEQGLDGVEDDPLGPDAVDGEPEPNEEPAEVVLAVLLHVAALDHDVVHHQLLLGGEVIEVEPQRPHVGRQLRAGLFEGDEHPRLVVLHGAAHQELRGQQGLATAGAAAHQRRPALRQPAPGDLVQPPNAAAALRELAVGGRAIGDTLAHRYVASTRDNVGCLARSLRTIGRRNRSSLKSIRFSGFP